MQDSTANGCSFQPGTRLHLRPARGSARHRLHLRRKNSGLTCTPETISDLRTFTPFTAVPAVTGVDAAWERVIVDEPATGDRMFGRVRVLP